MLLTNSIELVSLSSGFRAVGLSGTALRLGGAPATPRTTPPNGGRRKRNRAGASPSVAPVTFERLVGGNPANPKFCFRSEADCGKLTGTCSFSHSRKPDP